MSGKPVIAIDPGHNVFPDLGASYGEYSEDKIVLSVALALTKICTKNGIKTISCLPKSANSTIDSLQKRVRAANDGGATIYCSIHCNAATPTDGARGCETYAISSAGKTIGTNVNRELGKLGFKIRGVKETLDGGSAPYVVRNTNATAVLIEICFLDAAEDTKTLDLVGIEAIAQAIYIGLTHGSIADPEPDNHVNDPVVSTVGRSVLVDASRWYKSLPHQEAAWRALEKSIDPIVLDRFLAEYSPPTPSAPLTPSAPPTPSAPTAVATTKSMSVSDWINKGDGSTNGVKGLSDQIIKEMGVSNLIKFEHPRFVPSATCDPWFHPKAIEKLRLALSMGLPLVMRANSGYRSPVRQFVLRMFFEQGKHGISAAARVGTGNHEKGTALDIENHQQWKQFMLGAGFSWQGAGDPMHYDISVSSKVPTEAIKAFQRLSNRHQNSGLTEDGVWGDKTSRAMLAAPASGWIG